MKTVSLIALTSLISYSLLFNHHSIDSVNALFKHHHRGDVNASSNATDTSRSNTTVVPPNQPVNPIPTVIQPTSCLSIISQTPLTSHFAQIIYAQSDKFTNVMQLLNSSSNQQQADNDQQQHPFTLFVPSNGAIERLNQRHRRLVRQRIAVHKQRDAALDNSEEYITNDRSADNDEDDEDRYEDENEHHHTKRDKHRHYGHHSLFIRFSLSGANLSATEKFENEKRANASTESNTNQGGSTNATADNIQPVANDVHDFSDFPFTESNLLQHMLPGIVPMTTLSAQKHQILRTLSANSIIEGQYNNTTDRVPLLRVDLIRQPRSTRHTRTTRSRHHDDDDDDDNNTGFDTHDYYQNECNCQRSVKYNNFYDKQMSLRVGDTVIQINVTSDKAISDETDYSKLSEDTGKGESANYNAVESEHHHRRRIMLHRRSSAPHLTISTTSPQLHLFASSIVVPNLACASGLIHIVDEVFMTAPNIADTLGLLSLNEVDDDDQAMTLEDECDCIGDRLDDRRSIRLFSSLIQHANMAHLLTRRNSKYTVFAPVDSVLAKHLSLIENRFDSVQHLQEFIASHIVDNSQVYLSELLAKQSIYNDAMQSVQQQNKQEIVTELRTMNGKSIRVVQPLEHSGKQHQSGAASALDSNALQNIVMLEVMSETARVVQLHSDILSSNGVIHMIDNVLYNLASHRSGEHHHIAGLVRDMQHDNNDTDRDAESLSQRTHDDDDDETNNDENHKISDQQNNERQNNDDNEEQKSSSPWSWLSSAFAVTLGLLTVLFGIYSYMMYRKRNYSQFDDDDDRTKQQRTGLLTRPQYGSTSNDPTMLNQSDRPSVV